MKNLIKKYLKFVQVTNKITYYVCAIVGFVVICKSYTEWCIEKITGVMCTCEEEEEV